MIDHVGNQLACGSFGLDPGDELAARRAYHLDPYLGKSLVELLDDLLLDLREVRRVVDQLAFRLCGGDQFGWTEFLLGQRSCAVQPHDQTGDAGNGDDPRNDSLHGRSSLRITLSVAPRFAGLRLAQTSARRRSARRATRSAPG